MRVTHRLLISGRVQGVYYRESMRAEAENLHVAGWVRNLRDGRVEAMVQGDAQAVSALIDWARGGPPAARVDAVEITEVADAGSLQGFVRLPSA